MAKVQLNQKEQWYADTREQAEEIVSVAKENDDLMMHKITEKFNKYGVYFLIDLTYNYATPKEVMESRPQSDDAPDGQMNIDDVHEGVEYSVDPDGSISVKENAESDEEEFDPDNVQFEVEETPGEEVGEQKPIGELESDLPF